MSKTTPTPCLRCRKPTALLDSRWCDDCYYPGIDEDYARYCDLREEGYPTYQAKLMVGWADPSEDE